MIKNRAVIYARVSTERQKEKQTIDSQLSTLPEIIKQRGYIHILEPYIDDGISGETIEERPAMTRLLEDAERGLFDAVFVVDLDRLTRARKSIDWEIIKDSFRKGKVKVVTPGTEYDFEDEDQEFMSDMFSRIAAYEKKKILRRMMRGKKEKAKQGRFIGGKILYGYTYKEDSKEYEICESEAKEVRTMFTHCIEGSSVREITKHLNSLGIPTPAVSRGLANGNIAKAWATSTVTKILKNSTYAGDFKRWKHQRASRNVIVMRPREEWVSTEMPHIIERETFELAQDVLRGRQVLSKRNSKREYLLSGLINCKTCGCKMTGECSQGRSELLYYVCQNGRRKHMALECPIRSVRTDQIEPLIWNQIVSLLKTPKLLRRAIIESDKIDTQVNKIRDLEDGLHQKEAEEGRLIDLYQYGKIDRAKLNERIEKLNREIAFIKVSIESLNDKNKVDTRLKTINELNLNLEADLDLLSFEKKREILRILLFGKTGVGIFVDENYSVELRGLIDFSKLSKAVKTPAYGIANTSFS